MGPRLLDRPTVEDALFGIGFSILQETPDCLVIYNNNRFPGGEIALDWSRGQILESDLIETLEEEGITPLPSL